MSNRILLLIAITAVAAHGCAKRIPRPAETRRDVPRVSWVIMHGDRDNPDREYGCQSDPRDECIVPASTTSAQVFADVHFYYHGAGPRTTYAGSVRVGFLGDAASSNRFTVNSTAQKADSVGYQGITGIVSSTPGTYEVAIDVTGKVGDSGPTEAIKETIAVTVR